MLTHFFTHRPFLHKHMFTQVELDSQHAPSRLIVCPLKLGCLGVVEDPTAVGRTTRPWFSYCSYVLDLDLAMSILPIQNFKLVKGVDWVRFISRFKNSGLWKVFLQLAGSSRMRCVGLTLLMSVSLFLLYGVDSPCFPSLLYLYSPQAQHIEWSKA